jgi:hypothetical protein
MSSQDKTGDKLVASIRKTKAGANAQPPSASSEPASARPSAATKPATKKKVVRKKATAAPKKAPAAAPSYQSSGRVWPD